jgi:hypothetical protein
MEREQRVEHHFLLWVKQFQDGRDDVTDDEIPGSPTTSRGDPNVQKVIEILIKDHPVEIVINDHLVTLWKIVENLNMHREIVRLIFI